MTLTEFLNAEIKPKCDAFFDSHSHEFDLTHNEGCGLYTEALVRHMRALGYAKFGHLKKHGSATQYNGHANDAFLWREGDPSLYRAVDVIGAAESTDPNNPPRKNFGIDIPRYTDTDWMSEPNSEPVPNPVTFPLYEEDFGGDKFATDQIGIPLEADYKKANQSLNAGSATWFARTYYDSVYFTVVDKMTPQDAMNKSVTKRRPEWRKALDPNGTVPWDK